MHRDGGQGGALAVRRRPGDRARLRRGGAGGGGAGGCAADRGGGEGNPHPNPSSNPHPSSNPSPSYNPHSNPTQAEAYAAAEEATGQLAEYKAEAAENTASLQARYLVITPVT